MTNIRNAPNSTNQTAPDTEHSRLKLHRFCIAPMLDWTDRYCRYFHRLISKKAFLYSEMVTTGALIYGDRHRFLHFNEAEHPVALQLGGSAPAELSVCAKMAEDYGYDEVNLNVGCPSDRVQNGRFGACLMAEPDLVAECVYAMQKTVSIPITIKSRIGIDDRDSYEALYRFIATIAAAGCGTFIVHARKALLKGLSPKENREIPPLRYEMVFQLKHDFPDLEIIINGGVTSLDQAGQLLESVDGVMLGREIYYNPYQLAEVDQLFFDETCEQISREQIIESLIAYIRQELQSGVRLNHIARHVLGLYNGKPGARAWRRYLSENITKANADEEVVLKALKFINH